jgi:hypothetical protein
MTFILREIEQAKKETSNKQMAGIPYCMALQPITVVGTSNPICIVSLFSRFSFISVLNLCNVKYEKLV